MASMDYKNQHQRDKALTDPHQDIKINAMWLFDQQCCSPASSPFLPLPSDDTRFESLGPKAACHLVKNLTYWYRESIAIHSDVVWGVLWTKGGRRVTFAKYCLAQCPFHIDKSNHVGIKGSPWPYVQSGSCVTSLRSTKIHLTPTQSHSLTQSTAHSPTPKYKLMYTLYKLSSSWLAFHRTQLFKCLDKAWSASEMTAKRWLCVGLKSVFNIQLTLYLPLLSAGLNVIPSTDTLILATICTVTKHLPKWCSSPNYFCSLSVLT